MSSRVSGSIATDITVRQQSGTSPSGALASQDDVAKILAIPACVVVTFERMLIRRVHRSRRPSVRRVHVLVDDFVRLGTAALCHVRGHAVRCGW